MTNDQLTRRRMIVLAGGTATAALAGCLGGDEADPSDTNGHGDEEHTGVEAEYEAYVVAYHWGYAMFDEHGEELDIVEVAPNTDVTLHAVNDHYNEAVLEALPAPVAAELESFDALERTKQHVEAGQIPDPEDATIEMMYDEAHGGGHDDEDHGHDDEDHDDGHSDDDDGHGHEDDHDDEHGHDDDGHGHDGGKLDHGFMIPDLDVMVEVPADAEEPTTASFVTEELGTYQAMCTIDCGYGHAHQQRDLVRVIDDV